MTTIALPLSSGFALAPTDNRVVSDEARTVRQLVSTASVFEHTISLGERMRSAQLELQSAYYSALEDDWDGLGSAAVEPSTLENANQFLRILPSTVSIPEISIDRDGDICFEWDSGPRQVFSVSVGRDGTLTYAGLFGHDKNHGVESLGQVLSIIVSDNIKKATDTSLDGPRP